MKKKKTRRLYLRLTEDEFTEIKNRSEKFQSISHFVHSAINAFDNSTVKDRLELRNSLAQYYSKTEMHLAHIGGNLNQAMRQVNEAAIIGHTTQALIMNMLMPEIRQCMSVCIELRKELLNATNKAVK